MFSPSVGYTNTSVEAFLSLFLAIETAQAQIPQILVVSKTRRRSALLHSRGVASLRSVAGEFSVGHCGTGIP